MQAAVMPHPWKATQYRGFIEKVVLEGQDAVGGRTWAAQIREDTEAAEVIVPFTVEVVTDEEPGNIVLYCKLTAEQTALLPASTVWDIRESYDDDTEPAPLLKGTLDTAKAVTRPDPV
jgi:hypothetical protein